MMANGNRMYRDGTPAPKHVTPRFPKPARIRQGWHDEGREMEVVGNNLYVNGSMWTPVCFIGEVAPELFLTAAIDFLLETN